MDKEVIERFLNNAPATRYYGNKRKLLTWIYEVTSTLAFATVLDLFGGTASVSLLFKAMSKQVTYHDGLTFNSDVAHAILSDSVALDEVWVSEFLGRLQPCKGVVAENFDGLYYTADENRWIDGFMAAQAAQTLGGPERRLLRYLLYQACLRARFKSLSSIAVLCGTSHDHADGRDLCPCG
jgi:adenine-specific DNA-methyltransferase